MEACLKFVEKMGLRHFIFGGSLIGWYRHNQSFIPVCLTKFDFFLFNFILFSSQFISVG